MRGKVWKLGGVEENVSSSMNSMCKGSVVWFGFFKTMGTLRNERKIAVLKHYFKTSENTSTEGILVGILAPREY